MFSSKTTTTTLVVGLLAITNLVAGHAVIIDATGDAGGSGSKPDHPIPPPLPPLPVLTPQA